jgi:Helicase conserved C-terminal domain/Type III restriction enzyme, res subunit
MILSIAMDHHHRLLLLVVVFVVANRHSIQTECLSKFLSCHVMSCHVMSCQGCCCCCLHVQYIFYMLQYLDFRWDDESRRIHESSRINPRRISMDSTRLDSTHVQYHSRRGMDDHGLFLTLRLDRRCSSFHNIRNILFRLCSTPSSKTSKTKQFVSMDDSYETSGGASEAASARKLVLRAASRESALTSVGKDPNSPFGADFSKLRLKQDHCQRPCWTCPDGTLYLEAFHDLYTSAYDFLVAIAEPVARPEFVHQYKLTPYSLYAAVATNIDTEAILSVLERMSKNKLPKQVKTFVRDCTQKYGKAKLVLKHNKFYVESEFHTVLRELLRDPIIAQARVTEDVATTGESLDEHGFITQSKAEEMKENLHMLREPEDDSDEDDTNNNNSEDQGKKANVVVSFQVKGESVELVKRQAIELDYPLMDEYDFRNDRVNPDVPKMDLKPHTRIRRYQERALAKMFGNGRARSGIIVLPCGAGKTLTGVTAAQTIKKSVVCLATNAVSVLQWKFQFQLWTNIPDANIAVFTADRKDPIHPDACVLVTTYHMISFAGKRSEKAQEIMNIITSREWGLLLMDEVHVVPATMFRRVVGSVKAHCRLGLTATLVREDDLISDLNFLIGPKLYEANWMDLTTQGYLANVQCVEVWCPSKYSVATSELAKCPSSSSMISLAYNKFLIFLSCSCKSDRALHEGVSHGIQCSIEAAFVCHESQQDSGRRVLGQVSRRTRRQNNCLFRSRLFLETICAIVEETLDLRRDTRTRTCRHSGNLSCQ